MNLDEAFRMLRSVIPATERTVGITVRVMDYDHYAADDPARRKVEIWVWDGEKSYVGSTLGLAVLAAMLANRPDVQEAESLVQEAGEMGSNPSSETEGEGGGPS